MNIAGCHELIENKHRRRFGARFITFTHKNRFGEWSFVVVYDEYDQEIGGVSQETAEEIAGASNQKHKSPLQMRLLRTGKAKIYTESTGAVLWSTDTAEDKRTIPPAWIIPNQASLEWQPCFALWPIHRK